MKNIRMVVTAFSNGNENETYFPLKWTDLEFTGTGSKWGTARKRAFASMQKELKKEKKSSGAFEVTVDIYGASEKEQDCDSEHYIQTINTEF